MEKENLNESTNINKLYTSINEFKQHLVKEAHGSHNFEIVYSDGMSAITKVTGPLQKAIKIAQTIISSYKPESKIKLRYLQIFKNDSGYHSTAQKEYLVATYDNETNTLVDNNGNKLL